MPPITATTGFFAGDVRDRVVQALAAGHAAARAVDRHDQRLDAVVVGELRHRLVELAVLGDHPAHGQARKVRSTELRIDAAQRHQHSGQHGEHGKAPPDEQPALEPAPIQQQVGLERHGRWSAVSGQWNEATDPAHQPLR